MGGIGHASGSSPGASFTLSAPGPTERDYPRKQDEKANAIYHLNGTPKGATFAIEEAVQTERHLPYGRAYQGTDIDHSGDRSTEQAFPGERQLQRNNIYRKNDPNQGATLNVRVRGQTERHLPYGRDWQC